MPREPQLYSGKLAPDAEGRATLWYRQPEDAAAARAKKAADADPEAQGWKPIRLEGVETTAEAPSPNPPAHGRSSSAGPRATWGTSCSIRRTEKTTDLGDGGPAPMTLIVHDGKLYWSGYPSGPIYVYDPEPAVDASARRSPRPSRAPEPDRRATRGGSATCSAIPASRKSFSSAVGADGKIYFGGVGQRDYNGGGLGWYDPRTGEIGRHVAALQRLRHPLDHAGAGRASSSRSAPSPRRTS